MRSILITNDDGITSEGLVRLANAAKNFGRVWVVAPQSQRSAASHSITLHSPFDIFPYDFPVGGVESWSCSGTPGDCVRVGALSIMPEKPDVVLSGINYGYNVGSDIQYSATVGAALEGAFQGCLSIALSEEACAVHEAADRYLPDILEKLMAIKPDAGQIWNVNFPGCTQKECKGILEERTVSRGTVFRDHYNRIALLENGSIRVLVEGVYNEDAEEGTDFRAVVDRYISIGKVNNLGYPIG